MLRFLSPLCWAKSTCCPSQRAALSAVSESTIGTKADLWRQDRSEGRKSRGTSWRHRRPNAAGGRHASSWIRKPETLSRASELGQHSGSCSPSFGPCAAPRKPQLPPGCALLNPPPLLFTVVTLANTILSQAFSCDRSTGDTGEANPNHSKKQSSRIESWRARGRLRYGTERDFSLFHGRAPLSCHTEPVFPQQGKAHGPSAKKWLLRTASAFLSLLLYECIRRQKPHRCKNNLDSGVYVPQSMKETANFSSLKSAWNRRVGSNSAKMLKDWSNKINGTANTHRFLHSRNSLVNTNLT